MEKFRSELANIPVGISALFPSTKYFCREYITDKEPVFDICITNEDIDAEREINKKETENISFSDGYMETLALCRKIAAKFISYNVVLFHGCAVAKDGRAYIFTAKSGTGKTTHASLWLDNIPNCHILNGDKPMLIYGDGGIFVSGTPWMGKEGLGRNEILPLQALCVLERGSENRIEKISFDNAFPYLLSQTHVPDGAALQAVNLIKKAGAANLFRLFCNTDREAALVSYNAMKPGVRND